MPRKKKAQGEFVWIHFGEQVAHHAQLVKPMAENPPDDLNDDDSVEIVYTTSMTFAKVPKDSIEYPKQQQQREEQQQENYLADGVDSSPNKMSNALSPTRRSSRKRKSMSGPSLSSLPSPSPPLSSSIKKSATKNKSNKAVNSSSNRSSRHRKKSSNKNDTDLDEKKITKTSPRRQQSSNTKKKLLFDSDHDDDDDDDNDDVDTESNESEEDTQDLRNKSKKSKIDDEKLEAQEQSTSFPSSSFLTTLAAPFMGIFNNYFGSGGGGNVKSS